MEIEGVLIVRDEAECLADCLRAVSPVVDRLVIVDTGSQDDTIPIAHQFTDHVHSFAWIDDFAAARNAALSHCTADWVIQIDADEILQHSPEEARALLESFTTAQLVETLGTVGIASSTTRGGFSAQATTHLPRLFSPQAYCYEGTIHEQLKPISTRGATVSTGLIFAHSGYDGDADDRRQKARRNIPMLRRAIAASPTLAYYPYQLGKAYFSIGFYSAAASSLAQAHERLCFSEGRGIDGDQEAVPFSILIDLYTTWAYAVISLDRPATASKVLHEFAAQFPRADESPDFHFAVGYMRLMSGAFEESAAAFLRARDCPIEREAVAGTASHRAAYHLGLVAEGQHDLAQATEWYGVALDTFPDDEATLARIAEWPADYNVLPAESLWTRVNRDLLAQAVRSVVTRTTSAGDEARARTITQAWRAVDL